MEGDFIIYQLIVYVYKGGASPAAVHFSLSAPGPPAWLRKSPFLALEFDLDFASFSGCSSAPFGDRKAAQNEKKLSKMRLRDRGQNRGRKCVRPGPPRSVYICILYRRGIEKRGPHCVPKGREKGCPRPPFCLLK